MLARMTATFLNFRFVDRLRLGLLNPRFITRSLTLIFFLLALVLAARWVSLWLAPRAPAELPATVSNTPRSDFRPQAAKIFGQSSAGTGLAGYSLAGAYALGGGDGVAVFVSAQKQLSAKVGEEFAPGVRLLRVERGQAVVSVNGREQSLQVPEVVTPAQSSGQQPGAARPPLESVGGVLNQSVPMRMQTGKLERPAEPGKPAEPAEILGK